MELLDVANGFDVHDYRHGLKLLREDRETTYLANRNGFGCPACERAFDRLLVTEARSLSVGTPDAPVCLVRTDDAMLVLTH